MSRYDAGAHRGPIRKVAATPPGPAQWPRNPFLPTLSLYKHGPDQREVNLALWGDESGPPDGPVTPDDGVSR